MNYVFLCARACFQIVCVRACVCACVRACVRACMRVCVILCIYVLHYFPDCVWPSSINHSLLCVCVCVCVVGWDGAFLHKDKYLRARFETFFYITTYIYI